MPSRLATSLIAALLSGTTAAGVPAAFQQDCTGATLDGSRTLPIGDAALSGGVADFTLPASCQLGNTAFSDVVVCFTPEGSCDVDFTCSNSGGSNTRASILTLTSSPGCGADFSADTCTAGADVVPTNTSTASASLSAGQAYCFVCQNTVGNGSFTVLVTQQSGSCGALPVSLQSFDVGD